jgi:hypothetical protein
MLASFTAASRRIEAGLAALPLASLPGVHDTAEDVASLRQTLAKAVFALPPEHLETLRRFRTACDAVKGHAAVLEEQCKDVMQQVSGERSLSRSEYCAAVGDLQREIRTLRAYAVAAAVDSASAPPSAAPSPAPGAAPADAAAEAKAAAADAKPAAAAAAPAAAGAAAPSAEAAAAAAMELRAPGAETRETAELSAYYLRVLLDVIRACHDVDDENVPLEYLCPLSTLIMHVSARGSRSGRRSRCRSSSGSSGPARPPGWSGDEGARPSARPVRVPNPRPSPPCRRTRSCCLRAATASSARRWRTGGPTATACAPRPACRSSPSSS